MKLFNSKRNFDSIIAPLHKVEADLSEYIGEQANRISFLQQEKQNTEMDIRIAKSERTKSEHMVPIIAEILSNIPETLVTDDD